MFQPTRRLMTKILILHVFCEVFFELYRLLYDNIPISILCATHLETAPKFLEPIQKRLEIGSRLERVEFKIGAELGVKEGFFARDTLKSWPGATPYIVDWLISLTR